jgi:hypothetical protein
LGVLPSRLNSATVLARHLAAQAPAKAERAVRFEETGEKSFFYFPNDLERRYRWVKISPTMARNLVNGRVVFLRVGTSVILAPQEGSLALGQTDPAPGEASAGARNTLRIRNPNAYSAQVNLRSGAQNLDLGVTPYGLGTVRLPDGTYQVFFEFSDQPGKTFRGDDVTLRGEVAEIRLVSVVGGNYGLREVN